MSRKEEFLDGKIVRTNRPTKEKILTPRDCVSCGRHMSKEFLEERFRTRNKKRLASWQRKLDLDRVREIPAVQDLYVQLPGMRSINNK